LKEQWDRTGALAVFQLAIESDHADQAPAAAFNIGVLLEAAGDRNGAPGARAAASVSSAIADTPSSGGEAGTRTRSGARVGLRPAGLHPCRGRCCYRRVRLLVRHLGVGHSAAPEHPGADERLTEDAEDEPHTAGFSDLSETIVLRALGRRRLRRRREHAHALKGADARRRSAAFGPRGRSAFRAPEWPSPGPTRLFHSRRARDIAITGPHGHLLALLVKNDGEVVGGPGDELGVS
jgi:hypothetical protein